MSQSDVSMVETGEGQVSTIYNRRWQSFYLAGDEKTGIGSTRCYVSL